MSPTARSVTRQAARAALAELRPNDHDALQAGDGALRAADGWPAPPDPAAYHGLAGAIVERLAPHTEADPVAILTQLLIACGAMLGHARVLPGRSDQTPSQRVRAPRRRHRQSAQRQLVRSRRPPTHRRAPQLPLARRDRPVQRRGTDLGRPRPRKTRTPARTTSDCSSSNPSSRPSSRHTSREISTLSPTLRSAWDGRPLALLTRTAPATATQPRTSRSSATSPRPSSPATPPPIELANGFLNRFLIVRLPPRPAAPRRRRPRPVERHRPSAVPRRGPAARRHRPPGHVSTHDARELWWHAYPQLTQPTHGLAGHITARAEAHTIRLALIYALLDGQTTNPSRAPPRRARALGLHLPLRPMGARASDRRPARRTTPRRADPLPRRPDPHPALPPRAPQPPRRATRPSPPALAKHGKAHPQRILTAGRPAELWTATPPGRPPPRAVRAAQP